MSADGLNALYESLARYQWFRARCRRKSSDEALAMHKRLAAPEAAGPARGAGALNGWLFARVGPPPKARVLDVGCGFGATLFDWAGRGDLTGLGVTPSPFQVVKARRESARRGLDARLRFALRSYDEPWSERFDTVVAIESLAHAANLERTVRGLAAALEPGGTLALVEDMAAEVLGTDPDARELVDRWAAPATLPTEAAFRVALDTAGFALRDDIDLTGQVPLRDDAALSSARRRLVRLRGMVPLPGARRVCDAFLGGLALERLYARRLMRYRVFIAVREGGRTVG